MTKNELALVRILPGGIFAGLVAVFFSLTFSGVPVRGDGLEVDDETCLSCHEGYDAGLAMTVHALGAAGSGKVWCVSCHEGAQVHIDDPSKENITNPSRMVGDEARNACTPCHDTHKQLDDYGFDAHTQQQLNCSSCHKVHGGSAALLVNGGPELCQSCHVAVKHQFLQRSNHPMVEGTVSCVSCHDFRGNAEPSLGHGPSANCYACHVDKSGPFLFEHEATSSFSAEGSAGCVSCHNPHGSANDRLLTQTDANLCKQCHGLPAGHLTAHEGQFGQVNCVDCHSDIHGSYDNLFLLDPQLGTKFGRDADGCFCHYYR